MHDSSDHRAAPLHAVLVMQPDDGRPSGPTEPAWPRYRALKAQLRDVLSRQSKWHGLPGLLDELDRLRRLRGVAPR